VYVTQSVRAVDNLKTILALILPHTAQRLHEYLGYEGQLFGSAQGRLFGSAQGRLFGTQHVVEYQEEARSQEALTYGHSEAIGAWTPSELLPGQSLRRPGPLFKKLVESLIGEEYARLEAKLARVTRNCESRDRCPGSLR
jgi:hypothetical protein